MDEHGERLMGDCLRLASSVLHPFCEQVHDDNLQPLVFAIGLGRRDRQGIDLDAIHLFGTSVTGEAQKEVRRLAMDSVEMDEEEFKILGPACESAVYGSLLAANAILNSITVACVSQVKAGKGVPSLKEYCERLKDSMNLTGSIIALLASKRHRAFLDGAYGTIDVDLSNQEGDSNDE